MSKEEFDKQKMDCPCNSRNGHACSANMQGNCGYWLCPFIFWAKKLTEKERTDDKERTAAILS